MSREEAQQIMAVRVLDDTFGKLWAPSGNATASGTLLRDPQDLDYVLD